MFLLHTVTHPIKIMAQFVPFPVLMTINKAVLRLLSAEPREPGAMMLTQSTVLVCIKSLISIVLHVCHM